MADTAFDWNGDEAPDASGVHASELPSNAAEWVARLAPEDGLLPPAVEALLGAYVQLEKRHAQVMERYVGLQAVTERLPLGIVLLKDGKVLETSKEATRLLGCSSLGQALDGSLKVESAALQAKLDDALLRVTGGSDRPEPLRVGQGAKQVNVLLIPAGESLPGGVIAILEDPSRPIEAAAHVLQSHHGFTPTEARVATLLIRGQTPREIAESLGVGVETTRTHVKHILGKMGCHRQVDVVRRLVTGASWLA